MSTPLPPRRLTSWKEIAAFLGRDVRTVQRWERDGLPVHRRPGGKRSGVFAYEADLEAWLSGHADAKTSPPPLEATSFTRPTPSWRGARLFAAVAAGVALSGGLLWVAAVRGEMTPAANPGRLLAKSSNNLHLPRWADVDGDREQDLIVNAPSAVLIFRSAKKKECVAAAEGCADTRIQVTAACSPQADAAGDFNDDGQDDLLVSCLLREPEAHAATGPAFIVWGRSAWPPSLTLPADAGVTFATAAAHDDRVHSCVRGQHADLNGDAIADVLLGGSEVPFKERLSSGAVYVFFGRRAWPRSMAHQDADVTIGGSRMGEGLGTQCAAGDFDGDSHVDLAVYADEDRLWELLGGSGRAYIIPGRAAWPPTIDLAHEPAMRIDGLPSGTAETQLAMADLDHDGKQDLFFAAPKSRRSPSDGSVVAIWKGSPLRAAPSAFATADVLIKGASPGSRFGVSMVPSDLDQDGRREILVSDPGAATLNVLTARSLAGVPQFQRDAVTVGHAVPSELGAMAIHDGTLAIVAFDSGSWRVSLVEPFSTIAIDVRPYSDDDVILRPGVAAIGILGQRGAPDVEPNSLRAAGATPIGHSFADLNGDGIPDLIGRFKTEEMKLLDDATSLTLIGRRQRGDYVRGEAPIRIVSVDAMIRP